MKAFQIIALLIFISISLDAQEPRTAKPVTKQPTPGLLDENNIQEPSSDEVKRQLIDINQKQQRDIATIGTHVQDLSKLNDKLESASQEYSERLMNLIDRGITSANNQSDLEPILKELKEVHLAFNLQLNTAFQSFDQKQNQLFNLLSTVMKTNKEIEQSVTKNIR